MLKACDYTVGDTKSDIIVGACMVGIQVLLCAMFGIVIWLL
jgi:type IV secretory pathway TrbD component